MGLEDVLRVAATIIATVGGAGAIILGLSTWLGNVWANRLLEQLRAENTQALEDKKNELATKLEDKKNELATRLEEKKRFFVDLVAGR